MDRDSYLEGIRSAWLGERFGEVFFNALADRADDDWLRDAWRTLARLEHVTGAQMAGLLAQHGEPVGDVPAPEVGDDVLSRYTEGSHAESMARMRDVIEQAIVRFDQLLAVAPDSDVEAVQFLVHHEQALLTFVEREVSGDRATALHAVEALLTAPD